MRGEVPSKEEPAHPLDEFLPLSQVLHTSVKDTDPKSTFGELLAANKPKLIGIYYSMHTCPPCREFTPMLASLYEELNEDEQVLEIIYFSGDKN